MITGDYVVLCEEARVDGDDLHIRIGKAYDIPVFRNFPTARYSVSLALQFRFAEADCMAPMILELDMVDVDGRSIMAVPPIHRQMHLQVSIPAGGEESVLRAPFTLHDIHFPDAGVYVLTASVNGVQVGRQRVIVEGMPKQP